MENTAYDIIIIGGGPAGYTAAIYALRAGKKVLLIEKLVAGGQMAITSNIENYPGFSSVAGYELADKMRDQAVSFGLEALRAEVTSCSPEGKTKTVTAKNTEYTASAVIIASGAKAGKLGVEREAQFTGKGVSYCATCDGMFFRNRDVAVVGGGDTAFEDALYLSGICSKVYVIHRRSAFRAAEISVKRAEKKENIEFVKDSVVSSLNGEKKLSSVTVKNVNDGSERTIEISGLFAAVGRTPETAFLSGTGVALDDKGYVIASEDTRTNINGVYVCGDVRTKKLRQIVTACSDGAVAGSAAAEYVSSLNI